MRRSFDFDHGAFAAGAHRGVDFAAAPGAPVGAACSGRVAFAGSVAANDPVVTVPCDGWRVTHLPLRDVGVRIGQKVRRGERIGSVGRDPGHHGLHLGVRRGDRRWGYVDPLPLLGGDSARRSPAVLPPESRRPAPRLPTARPAPPVGRPVPAVGSAVPVAPREAPAGQPAVPVGPRGALAGHPAGLVHSEPAANAAGGPSRSMAPPATWLGLALVLAATLRSWGGRRRGAPGNAAGGRRAAPTGEEHLHATGHL